MNLCVCVCIYIYTVSHRSEYTPKWKCPNSTRCCKHSSEILVHIDMIASRSCCRFVGCMSMIRISRSTTSQRCSILLLDWDLVTVEAIWVKWTHCYVQEPSLRWLEGPKGAPHHYTTTTCLNHWDKAEWIHAFMFFTPNSDPTICMSQQKSRLIRPTFFQSSIVQFWWTCVNCSLRFLFLADRSGTRCGLLLL